MLDMLDRQQRLTGNQKKIVAAAIIGDMLEFFDYFMIGFVLAFIVGPWHLTYGESVIMLLSSGIGAIVGAFFFGWMADRVGRRPIFMATVLVFSIGTGICALTPEGNWLFLTIFRVAVGFGVGGLYSVDLPLVQEFLPVRMRGKVAGLVTVFVPGGTLLGSLSGAFLAGAFGWRGMFVVGLLPALLTLLIRAWVPESPRWLARRGRTDEARRSIAWALEVEPEDVVLPPSYGVVVKGHSWGELFKYKRSWGVSWLTSYGMQSAGYGINLWGPTLIALLLSVSASQAAFYFIFVTLAGICGRVAFSFISDRLGRRAGGILATCIGSVGLVVTGLVHSAFLGPVSAFILLLIPTYFVTDGSYAITGPYSAEVWPAALRTSGMGSAYGFGSLAKITGPLGLAIIAGSSNLVTPQASVDAILPSYIYLAAFQVLALLAFVFFGFETKDKSLEEIEQNLARMTGAPERAVA